MRSSDAMKPLQTSLTVLLSLLVLSMPSAAFAGDEIPDGDDDGLPVITSWGDPPSADVNGETGGAGLLETVAAQACWGHFYTVQDTADGAQYSGYTQCNGPHYLEIRIALYRWDSDLGAYRYITSVSNARFAWYVVAIDAEPCTSQLSTRYKMRAFPTMDGIQMAGYAGWSDPFTITCRVPF